MNATFKTVMLWMSLLVVVFLAWHFAQFQKKEQPVKFSEFMAQVESGQVSDVTITGNEIKGHTVSREAFRTFAPVGYDKLTDTLLAKKVTVNYQPDQTPTWANMLISWAPFLLLIGFWIFFMRQMQSGGNKALSFGKSKAKLLASQQKKVTFKDVAGVEEAKDELQEIIEFLREPQKFQKLGGRIPKGVLLMGPPGSGKTLLARAIAGEANVPFFSISGSDFLEMFVGVGASRVRDLFEQGKKNAPCIIFIDEIDAVGRHRGAGLGGGHDEREQTLNALLVEMDGFESNDGVILIAATNRPDVLDPALLRPGRFDRRVVVSRPDVRGREGILQVHTRKIPLAEDVDISVLARATPGFSGADLANLVNEAALMAARNNQKFVSMKDFESSKDKVLMGAERKSLIITDEEKKVTAFHEAGHALLAALVPHADPIHKVTIIPRGMALGVTQQLPTEEKHNWTKEQLEARIAVCMGGRIAEESTFAQITTGAQNDIEQATEMARKMVCEWGMSEALGPLTYGKKEEAIFLGKEFNRHQD
ncbi:MAG TPA: ATP-dependent zinc metalloprotease FtsH, partial [Vicinamibacteria bacterium]|nr:ATP-dependent zinc metalloprotease FtsH [Vicinamibacteria bacterium]